MEVEFEVISVARRHKKIEGTRTDMSLIMVQLVSTAHIFNLTKLGPMLIKVASQKVRTSFSQWHRYQKYGHNKYNCHRSPRGVKCAEQQVSHVCQKPRDTTATCTICGDLHPANFRDVDSPHKPDQTRKPGQHISPKQQTDLQ